MVTRKNMNLQRKTLVKEKCKASKVQKVKKYFLKIVSLFCLQ